MYSDIIDILTKAAVHSYKLAHSRKKHQLMGWNRHVAESHGEARLRYQEWLLHNKPLTGEIYEAMRVSQRVFRGKLKWCQNHQEQIRMDIIATHHASSNFTSFWKATKSLNSGPGKPVSVEGCTQPRDIANLFKQHFRVESPLGPSQGMVDAETSCGLGGIRFSCKEVANVIKKMKRGKSPGHDGLSIAHLKHAGSHLPRVLSMFFSLCLVHSYLPHDLMRTIVVPIIKNKTGDIADKSNYRPISLATVLAKVLDSLLDSRLYEYLVLHDAQFGFRSGLSTDSAILSLKHTVKYYTERRTPIMACFLDLSKAFDLVSYDKLWDKMREADMPDDMVRLFQYWYLNQVNSVRWHDSMSDEYRLECGVRQGGLTSPKLFNLYINELIVDLSSRRVGCHIDNVCVNNLSYADDMVLLTPTIGSLRRLLQICQVYAQNHGLSYNVSKSEYMVFGVAGKRVDHVPPLTLGGVQLRRVDVFKYLGHYLTEDLRDHVDIARERRALAVRCNMLARRFARCSKEVKITLFKAYCQNLYTGSLWVSFTLKPLNALRVQYNNAFRVLLGLPPYCSASAMFAEAGVDGFHAVWRKRSASLLSRIRGSSNSILKVIAARHDSPVLRHVISRVKPYMVTLVN